MHLNVLHRPGTGKNFDLYRIQQEYTHKLNLKTTIMMGTDTMTEDTIVNDVLSDSERYGDEIALWLWNIGDIGGGAPFWLLSEENKIKAFRYAYDMFKGKFNREPVSIGCYVLDLEGMRIIREISPHTTTVVASCFEEGVKVYHGCNHSWYLFSEGGSWTAWYPSKSNSLKPAADNDDWNGLVAVPHLSRDLALAFEGRNDFFASHPANVQRGLANDGEMHNYDYNLIDQYVMQEDFNDGYSFYQVHVGPSWLGDCANIRDIPEVSQKLYYETFEYLAKLRDEGLVQDEHMSEFGEWYKNNVPIDKANVGLGKEMLYGSGKHMFWYIDSGVRALIDANLGGSIGDLRPYIAECPNISGPHTSMREIASYPYLIHSQYRTGTVTHYKDGSRTTLFVSCGGETVDLCEKPTKTESVVREGEKTILTLKPVCINFSNGKTVKIVTVFTFKKGGEIRIKRKLSVSGEQVEPVIIKEYFKGCYGYTDYAEDMTGIVLKAGGDKEIVYKYEGRSIESEGADYAAAVIPQVNAKITMLAEAGNAVSAAVREGHLFTPFYTLELSYKINENECEVETCLKIEKDR